MEAGGTSWGAVKVYAKTTHAYDERAEEILRRLADQAAIFVSNVAVARSAKRIGDEVKTTLRTRDVIATATGVMMSRKGLEHEDAYRHLMSLASSAGIPLAELAERMLAAPVRPRTDP
jgi:AmiR/NasT family two-component response regulator